MQDMVCDIRIERAGIHGRNCGIYFITNSYVGNNVAIITLCFGRKYQPLDSQNMTDDIYSDKFLGYYMINMHICIYINFTITYYFAMINGMVVSWQVWFAATCMQLFLLVWYIECGMSNCLSPPSATYMRQRIGWALVQIRACHVIGAKPLSEPGLGYCQLDP